MATLIIVSTVVAIVWVIISVLVGLLSVALCKDGSMFFISFFLWPFFLIALGFGVLLELFTKLWGKK